MQSIAFPPYPPELLDKNWKAAMDPKDKNTGVGELLRSAGQAYKKIKPSTFAEYSSFDASQAKPQGAAKEFDAKFDADVLPLVRLLNSIQVKAAAIKNPQPKTKTAAAQIVAEAKKLAENLAELANAAHDNIKQSSAQFAARKTAVLSAIGKATDARRRAIAELNESIASAKRLEQALARGFAGIDQLDAFAAQFDTLKADVDDMLNKRHAARPIREDIPEAGSAAIAPFAADGNDVADAAKEYKACFAEINPPSKQLVSLLKNLATDIAAARHQLTKDTEAIDVQFANLFKTFRALDNAKLNERKFINIFETERTLPKLSQDERARAVKDYQTLLDLESANVPTAARSMKFSKTLLADITRRVAGTPDRAVANQVTISTRKFDELSDAFRKYVAAYQKAVAAFSRIKTAR